MITQKEILKAIQKSQDNGGHGINDALGEIDDFDGFGITESIDQMLASIIHRVEVGSMPSYRETLSDLDYAIDQLQKARAAFSDLVEID